MTEKQETFEHSWQGRLPFFYGWVIVAVAFFMGFMAGGAFWAASVIAIPMREDLGWSLSSIYLGLTVRMLVGAGGMLLLGRFADLKNGARLVGVVSGVIAAISLAATSLINSQWEYILFYGVIGGLATSGTGFLVMSAVVPRWFLRYRGRAVAMATMGTGAAAFTLPPLVAFILEFIGWRGTWVILGSLTFLFSCLPALLVWRQPEDVGLLPDGIPADHSAQSSLVPSVRSYTASEAIRTKTMWILLLAIAAASLSPNGVPSTLVPMYIDKGFSTHLAALGFSIYGLFSMLARFFWGYLADRYHIRNILIAIGIFTGMSMPLMLILQGNSALIYAAFMGFGIGGFVGTQQLVWPSYFGRNHLGAIAGLSMPVTFSVMAIGPLLMAQSFDRTGGYGFGLVCMGISWAVCAGAMYVAKPAPSTIT
jgi:MFS family permease